VILLPFSKKMVLARAVPLPSIKFLDDLCRSIVRIRDKMTCRRCGRSAAQGFKVEWAHFISRSNKAVRWDLDNSCMLCFECHYKFMHGHGPEEHTSEDRETFWRSLIGGPAFQALTMRATGKGGDRRLVKIYLEQEKEKLCKSN